MASAAVEHCIERATHYQNEVLKEISNHPTADTSDRSVVATAFIKMAVGDFKAILTEIGSDNPGPAFKVFRLLYEDLVNGLWTQEFASDDLIDKLLNTDHGQLPGPIADRAAKLDTVFVPPPATATEPVETLFVYLQNTFWKAANSYTHGGSMAINRELTGFDDAYLLEILRCSTLMFILLVDAMYRLHYKKPNDALGGIIQAYFGRNGDDLIRRKEVLDYGRGTRSRRQEHVGYFLPGDFHECLHHNWIKLNP